MDKMDKPNGEKSPKPIPAFASREAEAEFWDTHDFTDYASFDHPAEVRFAPSGETVPLFVDRETLALAKAIAAEQRVPWEGLLELWLVERREAERAAGAPARRESA